MSSQQFPLIDAREILRVVGGAAFTRGKGYADTDRILDIDWDDSDATLSADVQGTDLEPYTTVVQLVNAKNGWRIGSAYCSCPVGQNCKHTAAIMIESNSIHMRAKDDIVVEAPVSSPAWHQSLDGLLAAGAVPKATSPKPQASSDAVDPSGRIQPLALQFELQDNMLSAHRQWAPGSGAGRQRAARRFQLGVRPMVRSGNGRWVRGNLRWNSISFKTYGLNLDEEQHRWFCQFVPLHRANGQLYFGEDNDWINLDDFSSPLLWTLLGEARDLGIEFIGRNGDADIRVADPAGLVLAAVRPGGSSTEARDAGTAPVPGDDDGPLTLAPALTVGEENVLLGGDVPAGPIGHHGAYLGLDGGHRILLAPMAHRLNPTELEMFRHPESIEIPRDDVDRFLKKVYPRLGRKVTVASPDGSVELPDIQPPKLVLKATFTGEDEAEMSWDFDYGDVVVDADTRDATAEAELERAVLRALEETPLACASLAPRSLKGLQTVDLIRHVIPAVEATDGAEVRTSGDQPPFHELTEAPELTVTTVESERRDWFDLGLIIAVGDLRIPYADILRALSRGQTRMLMPDKTYFSLEQPLFDKLRELVSEATQLTDGDADALQITRYQASLWEELDALAVQTEGPDSWYAGVGSLLDFAESGPVDLPSGLRAELRPYQLSGFGWLATLWRNGLGGVLADDMGLGKTLQTLALMLHAKQTWATGADRSESTGDATNLPGPFLVVAPTSVVSNWEDEAKKFAPDLRVATVSDTQPRATVKLATLAAEYDIVITSYTLFRLDADAYQEQTWAGLVLDEAQFVKNKATKAHQAARDLTARFKLAITGTPMENNLMELWSIFSIVSPGLFPSAVRFAENYQRPIERQGLSEPLGRLRRRVRPFMLRRTKDAVVTDLPPKQEQVLHIDLTPKHRKIYDTHLQRERQKILRLVEDMDKNRFTIFQSLTLLRMLSLDASLVDDEYAGVASAKLDVLFEQLEDVLAEGHRALVFSQFTSFLKRAASRLKDEGVEYVYLDGSTRRRQEVIAAFKEGRAPVFLISLKAGGFGLNLTEADYCFLLDPWWNPAAESQAVDRAHRIGQTRNVMVYRMVAKDTIEEKVVALQDAKRKLISSVMDEGEGFGSTLTADDIRDLLKD
ncbi:DEAD/DEAH box helicase [Zhihengliuella halotolerans]|uniref:SNF2 family DNA or RNA helicase n=1 Tax=Zhihengliuella halotolerans TaxID=370736 RepID=A0A4Q8A981_9MICC|nr:DEAD/DEAH box helicase [Zhihengliuella halotolerans]RZU60632.1 SNF2 family DNA or RNA helicase [Zhihengliuella halotolerans]